MLINPKTTKMNKLNFFILLVILFTTKVFTQTEVHDNIIGKKHIINSKILKEDRVIQVYIPDGYDTSKDKKYPVLYILDGQRLFLHGVSVIQSFNSQFQLGPDMIVVGINNKYPNRFNHFLGTDFLDFIEKELMTYISNNYRASDERLLFGWEYAGAFVIESMINRPYLFDAHIAASPYPIHEDRFEGQSRIGMLKKKMEEPFSSFLYFTVSANEGMVEDGTNELEAVLKKKAPETLNWNYRIIDGEEHRSTAHASLYQGLRNYYHDYPIIQIKTLDKFKQLRGIAYVYNYYKSRAKRFGFSEKLSPWTMFTLTRNALRADSFEDFEFFMCEFKDSGMINGVRLDRAMSFASYYIKHNNYQKAIEVYENLTKKNSNSASLKNAIGDIYYLLKDNITAKLYYKQAIILAKEQKDNKLEDYLIDFKKMK